ncbi:hypothetical protein CC80DRAFT_562308 [Byssothecium circinans]|uniref:NAD(P)-binding protein n=1 Tax=Byssothecium circinans TaxID=147558 RepID=A0A6A5TVK2_9PLEO|nr:hypothetical protein CC80DRAFT_562308 [Byssothecium circinans]
MVLCAGIQHPGEIRYTSDGIEKHFGVNHTTPADVSAPSTSSIEKNSGMNRYLTSKLANVLWALALSRHLASSSSNRTAVAFDPGLVPGTAMLREAGAVMRFMAGKLGPYLVPVMRMVMNPNVHTVEQSAGNLAWVVESEDVMAKRGVYYEGGKETEVSIVAGNQRKQEELWEWTIQRVAEGIEERERFGRLE